MIDVHSQVWFSYLTDDQQCLVETAAKLFENTQDANYKDYSFVVFPMAKAYEGFLKKYFFDLDLISQREYEGHRFRVGRAFNPDINGNQRDELWIFDDVTRLCGYELAREMWDAWIACRNQVFHYFPYRNQLISHAQAEAKLRQLAQAMEGAVHCEMNHQRPTFNFSQLNHHSRSNHQKSYS